MKSCFATLTVLLACGTTTAQAAGTLSASVSFTDLAFSASDLTPSDGVDPFFEILPGNQHQSTTSIQRDAPAFSSSDDANDFLAPTSLSHSFADGASALAQVTGTGVQTQVAGSAQAIYALQSSANILGTPGVALIRIAPGTRLTFYGNAHLQASATGCGADCYAQAVLALDFGYLGEEGSTTKTLFSDIVWPTQSYTAPMNLSYANTSSEDQFLGLSVRASTEVASLAVPEPATAAVALGGGLLSLAWGRSKRQG